MSASSTSVKGKSIGDDVIYELHLLHGPLDGETLYSLWPVRALQADGNLYVVASEPEWAGDNERKLTLRHAGRLSLAEYARMLAGEIA